jgi:hypothetical protein
MDRLAAEIIAAHGGLEQWRKFTTLKAHLIQGGALWALKGKDGLLDDTWVTVDLTREHASHAPFGDAGRYSSFAPDRVALLDAAGATIAALDEPRASFAGHVLETPWSDLQLAYFAGCAMWTYLNTPFLLAQPDVQTEEIDPWDENGAVWRRLRVRFPARIATHSSEQTLYVGDDGLLRRHDYDVEIAGNTPGAHLISDHIVVEGIKIPTRRRIFPRAPDLTVVPEPLVVSIDLDRITLA